MSKMEINPLPTPPSPTTPPPTKPTTITTKTTTTTTATTTATTTTLITSTALTQEAETTPATVIENSNVCVLASSLSATSVILFFLISGLVYYFYKRRQKRTIAAKKMSNNGPDLPTKLGRNHEVVEFSNNPGFQSDKEYSVPPNREHPLPRKKGDKKDNQRTSPYHAAIANPDDYSVPPIRDDSILEPPLPPNVIRKMQEKKKKKETDSNYYLDMDGITDDFYQNVSAGTTQDDIYINH